MTAPEFVKITATAEKRTLETIAPLDRAWFALGELVAVLPDGFVWEWEPVADIHLKSASAPVASIDVHTASEEART